MLIISLVINGVGLWQMFSSTVQTREPVAVAANVSPPIAVKITNKTSGNTKKRTQSLGQVESPQQATILAKTGGVIKQLQVQAGDRVSSVKVITVISDTGKELVLIQAQGNEREAIDNLERRTELVKQGAIAERLLVEARTAVDDAQGTRLAAQAALAEAKAGPTREEIAAEQANVAVAIATVNQAKLALARTRIRAVSGGVVPQRKVSPGDYVEINSEIVNLIAGKRLDIFLELPEQISGQVKSGTRVELTARALPQWRGNATISGVLPSADAASRRQCVRVRLDTPASGLLPGMAVTVNL